MKKTKTLKIYIILSLLLALAIYISLSAGHYGISPHQLIAQLISGEPVSKQQALVFWQIRLPRILAAILIGFALPTAGATYQSLFKNPMASPATLGASSGAAFGAVLAIYFSLNYDLVIGFSFSFGLVSVLLAWWLSRIFKFDNTVGLLLMGIVIGSLFGGLISLLKLLADPLKALPEMTYWLFGSLSGVSYLELAFASLFIIIAWLVLYQVSFKLRVLSLGDDEAKSMGINIAQLVVITIICATLLTAASIAIVGLISWVGLLVPHMARRLVGPNLKVLIPISSLLGSIFILITDTLSRTMYSSEIPLGILFSLIGVPLFIWMLSKRRSPFYD